MAVFDVGKVYVGNKEIWLKKFSGADPLNIYPQVKGFDIFENLDNHTLVANFFITDGIELINEYPLGGEETITVSIQTPSRQLLPYEFQIESIQGMKTNDASNLRMYMLRCVTRDYLKNSFTVFSKRYTDMKYDEALTQLIQTDAGFGTPLITIEKTKGKFDYVVNTKRPFQIVDVIKERAVSQKYKSSLFVFYQDWQGYHFQTVEKLIKEREVGDKKFFYDTGNRNVDYEKIINVRNILSYETMAQGQQIKKVKAGAMRTQIREFDLHRGTYYPKEEYINPAHHKVYEATDDKLDLNSPPFNGYTTAMPAITRMAMKDGLRPEMEHNKNIHWQRPFMERLNQYGLRVRVYGDTNIRVGDKVEINLPEISGLTRKPKKNKIFSNNYIVTGLKHRLDKNENNDFNHTMVMELRKPNQFGEELG
jgi:hypothetical protein